MPADPGLSTTDRTWEIVPASDVREGDVIRKGDEAQTVNWIEAADDGLLYMRESDTIWLARRPTQAVTRRIRPMPDDRTGRDEMERALQALLAQAERTPEERSLIRYGWDQRARVLEGQQGEDEYVLLRPDGNQERWTSREAFLRGCARMAGAGQQDEAKTHDYHLSDHAPAVLFEAVKDALVRLSLASGDENVTNQYATEISRAVLAVLLQQGEPTNEMIQAAAIVLWEKGNERLGVERDREVIGEYVDEAEAALHAALAARENRKEPGDE